MHSYETSGYALWQVGAQTQQVRILLTRLIYVREAQHLGLDISSDFVELVALNRSRRPYVGTVLQMDHDHLHPHPAIPLLIRCYLAPAADNRTLYHMQHPLWGALIFHNVHNWYLLLGLLLRGFTERRHERLRGVLPSNQRNNVLVSQSILRARGGRRRLDGK
jgi:hypothetical protein